MQDIPTNKFKHNLSVDCQYGYWLSLLSSISAEIASDAGFDWLLVDMEHSANEIASVTDQLRAINSAGRSSPIVRPPSNDATIIKRLLDAGAQTLLIPYVENARDAEAAVSATRYAPEGVRGFSGMTRANRFGRVKDYAKNAAEEICVIVQIESQKAIDNLDEIIAVDGVDAVFVGPADLAVDLGTFGKYMEPAVWQTIGDVRKRANELGKPCGILIFGEEGIKAAREAEFDFIGIGADHFLLARGTEQLIANI